MGASSCGDGTPGGFKGDLAPSDREATAVAAAAAAVGGTQTSFICSLKVLNSLRTEACFNRSTQADQAAVGRVINP